MTHSDTQTDTHAHTPADELDYAHYLQLETLLGAQQPVTDDPDEWQFIIVHQVHELWFKLALHHLARARLALHADQVLEATRLVRQVLSIFDNLIAAVEQLQSLPPAAFHRFRAFLAPASGLQSYQFRAIEFLCGLRDPRQVAWVRRALANEAQWNVAHAQLEEPSLAEALTDALARQSIPEITAIYTAPDAYPALYALCETLSELDQRVTQWRFSHVQLVERTIGAAATGTGGTTHDYLQATLRTRLFPDLWEARSELTRRIDRARHVPPPG